MASCRDVRSWHKSKIEGNFQTVSYSMGLIYVNIHVSYFGDNHKSANLREIYKIWCVRGCLYLVWTVLVQVSPPCNRESTTELYTRPPDSPYHFRGWDDGVDTGGPFHPKEPIHCFPFDWCYWLVFPEACESYHTCNLGYFKRFSKTSF